LVLEIELQLIGIHLESLDPNLQQFNPPTSRKEVLLHVGKCP
jgi:hypothetical protein